MGTVSQIKPLAHTARDEVAASVRAFIARAGVSKSAVARATGFTQSTFSRRANGQEPFNIDELGTLADYFGVDVVDLIVGDANKIPPNAKKAPTPKGGGQSYTPPDSNREPTDYGLAPVTELPTKSEQRADTGTLAVVTQLRA